MHTNCIFYLPFNLHWTNFTETKIRCNEANSHHILCTKCIAWMYEFHLTSETYENNNPMKKSNVNYFRLLFTDYYWQTLNLPQFRPKLNYSHTSYLLHMKNFFPEKCEIENKGKNNHVFSIICEFSFSAVFFSLWFFPKIFSFFLRFIQVSFSLQNDFACTESIKIDEHETNCLFIINKNVLCMMSGVHLFFIRYW